jgi:hypothetical protein
VRWLRGRLRCWLRRRLRARLRRPRRLTAALAPRRARQIRIVADVILLHPGRVARIGRIKNNVALQRRLGHVSAGRLRRAAISAGQRRCTAAVFAGCLRRCPALSGARPQCRSRRRRETAGAVARKVATIRRIRRALISLLIRRGCRAARVVWNHDLIPWQLILAVMAAVARLARRRRILPAYRRAFSVRRRRFIEAHGRIRAVLSQAPVIRLVAVARKRVLINRDAVAVRRKHIRSGSGWRLLRQPTPGHQRSKNERACRYPNVSYPNARMFLFRHGTIHLIQIFGGKLAVPDSIVVFLNPTGGASPGCTLRPRIILPKQKGQEIFSRPLMSPNYFTRWVAERHPLKRHTQEQPDVDPQLMHR